MKTNELPREVVELAQYALHAQGLYAGLLDGEWGPLTEAGYQRYLAAKAPVKTTPAQVQTSGMSFAQWYDLQGIKDFSAAEVLYRGGSDERLHLNTDPPRELWARILPTLRVLSRLRAELGVPISLTSIYRSPAYNSAIGGASQSFHKEFRACDFQTPKGTPKQWAEALHRMRAAGVFSGGIGIYPTFVHVDTRGYNADF